MRSRQAKQNDNLPKKNSQLAWRLRLAEKESEVPTTDNVPQQLGLRAIFKSTLKTQNNAEQIATLPYNEENNSFTTNSPVKNDTPLPQNLEIVTYRGLNDADTAKLATYHTRQQIAYSDAKTNKKYAATNVKLIQQLQTESAATLTFGKLLAKNLWHEGKSKVATKMQETEAVTFKNKLSNLIKSKWQGWQQTLKKWQTVWQKSPANTAIANAELTNLKFPKRYFKYKFSLQNSAIIVLTVLLLLTFSYSFFSWRLNNKYANDVFHKTIAQSKGLQLAGQLKETTKELQQINLQIAYPSFDDAYLNHKIKQQVNNLIQPYIKAAKNLKVASQSRFKPLVVVNYDANILAKRLLSVIFTLNYYEHGSQDNKLSDWQYSAFHYDLPNHQVLSMHDLFPDLTKTLHELAVNFDTLYRYEHKDNLNLNADQTTMQNLLFLPDKLILIVDPKQCKANLKRPGVDEKQLITLGGSRELFANYFDINYADAAKIFNQSSEQKLALSYDVWEKYYNNKDKDKLLPYDFANNKFTPNLPFKFLALSINGLPSATEVNTLINLLKENQAHATFFISLETAKNTDNQAIIKELLQAGHEMAALITSKDLASNDNDNVRGLCKHIKDEISKICQTDIKYLRLGNDVYSVDPDILSSPIIASNNKIERFDYTSETISKFLESNPEAGDIISFNAEQSSAYLTALKQSLPLLKEQQVRYVNITECVTLYKKKLRDGVVYDSFS